MKRRRLHAPVGAAALVVAALLAGCSHDAPAAHAERDHHDGPVEVEPAGAAAPTRHVGPQGRSGQFVISCGFSHRAPDDPIVHPRRPGLSHSHDFFGNTTTDADSDLESLLAGGTTCRSRTDTASYWAPTLLADGEPVEPTGSDAYYRAAPGVPPERVQPHPAGLMVVAGDMAATTAQDTDLVGWACGVSARQYSTPPACSPSAPLRAVITFPDCWDGRHLDSADHRSHLANSTAGECPDSHPVHVPQLTFAISYPVWGQRDDLTLSSGSTKSLHADFVNSWDQAELERRVELCVHRDRVCSLATNRAEAPRFGT